MLSSFDILIGTSVLALFLILPLLLISKSKSANVFKTSSKLPWWLGASSLLIIYWNPTLDMINTKLVLENGYSGLWFLKDVLITIGIAPILFVPMWARLNITTDNQLIRLRFSGNSAKYLQIFRAIYVGFFICAFLGSFYLLGIRKIVSYYLELTELSFFLFILVLTLLIILKNNLASKIKSDAFVSLLFLLIPTLSIIFLVDKHGGLEMMNNALVTKHWDKIQIVSSNKAGQESISNIVVFLFVQWWSVRILDHSNANTQRYFSIGDPWNSFRAILLPVIIISFTFGLSSFVWDAALLSDANGQNAESLYVKILVDVLPEGLKGLLIVTFILGFITTFEAILSWGSSLLSIDLIKDNWSDQISSKRTKLISYMCMLMIGLSSVFIAIKSENLIVIQKFLFSVGAGVGPVFFLRWFWWRINAWSQLSAMVASMVLSLSYDFFYDVGFIENFVDAILMKSSLSFYSLKLIIVTTMVTAIWLSITFLTKEDDKDHLRLFVEKTQTGGVWPFKTEDFNWGKKLFMILLLGISAILPLSYIWYFKFGSKIVSLALFCLWIGLIYLVYRSMKALFFTKITDDKIDRGF